MGIILNAIVVLTAAQLAGAVKTDSRAIRLVAFGLAATSLIVWSMLLAGGVFRRLDAFTLALIHVALLALSIAIGRRDPREQARSAMAALADAGRLVRTSGWLAAASVVLAAVYAYALLVALLLPPFTGDAMLYHLPLSISFLDQQDLMPPELPGFWKGKLWAWFPANASLLFAWPLLTTKSDLLIDAVQWPYAFLTAVALFALARSLGLSKRLASWAGLSYLAIPLVINQTKTCLTDVILSFVLVSAVLFLVRFEHERPWQSSLLVAVAVGLALGLKTSALVHVPLLAAVGLVWIVHNSRGDRRAALKSVSICFAASCAGFLALGAYWYLRNAWLVGEFLYPSRIVNPPRFETFSVLRESAMLLLRDCVRSTYAATSGCYNFTSGIGVQVVALSIPGAALAAFAAVRGRQWRVATLCAASFAGVVIWWFLLPQSGPATGRYALAWFAVMIPLALHAIGGLSLGSRLLPPVAMSMCLYSAVLSLPAIGAVASYDQTVRAVAWVRDRGAWPPAHVVRPDLVVHDFRDAWSWIAENASGRRLAVSNHAFTYPLYGDPTRPNDVIVIPATTRREWLDEIDRRGVEYVLVRRHHPGEGMKKSSERTRTGHKLVLVHATLAVSLELSGVAFAPADGSPIPAGRRVTLMYRTGSKNLAGSDRIESGRFALVMNSGVVLDALESSAARGENPENPDWSIETFALPPGTQLDKLAIIYMEHPLRALRIASAIEVRDLLVHLDSGEIRPLSLDERSWQHLTSTLEEMWMETLPDRFQLVHESPDRALVARLGETEGGRSRVKIFRVIPR